MRRGDGNGKHLPPRLGRSRLAASKLAAWRLAAWGLAACGLAACGAPGDSPRGGGGEGLSGPLLVSAASSLTEAFADVADAFEARHPGVDVQLNLAGSSTLRAQILEGAPVDLFAPADPSHMEAVGSAGFLDGAPRVFAENRLTIAVPAGNPAGVTGLEDFRREELLLGLCAPEVPCGARAAEALARAGVEPRVDTWEPNVRALLTKVELGELDAGVTYATDVAAGAGVESVPLETAPRTVYPVAVLAGASNPAAARAFVDFLLSPEARTLLTRRGFSVP